MTTAGDEQFRWTPTPVGRALRASSLDALACHLFTSRDVSFRGGTADAEYGQLGASFDLPASGVTFVTQVHGRTTRIVRPGEALEGAEADAIISTDPMRAIAVRVADCVPILIADTSRRVVAAVHAGWRGTAAGVSTATVEAIASLGISPATLVAAIGPSIGPCCYQVDGRVHRAFLDAPRVAANGEAAAAQRSAVGCFADDGPDHWRLDLWRANAEQLQSAGVPAVAIHVARYCTADHLDRCYSYRVEGPGAGRMIAAIRLASSDDVPRGVRA